MNRDRSEEHAKALKALSNPERLNVLSYLKEEGETTLEELSDYMGSKGYENTSVSLMHKHLPLLEDYGVFELEEDKVKYEGDNVIEEIIETLEEVD